MLKQYFTDGLVQIAIVLSLLRTDLNSYLRHNYVNYPEVQELILGPTAAYTQTNFHNNIYSSYYGSHEIHRKSIDLDTEYLSTIYRDLRSLRHLSNVRDRNVPTYLIVGGSNNFAIDTGTENSQNEGDANDNSDNQLDSLEAEGQNLLNTLEQTIEAIAPLYQNLQATDPTVEVYKLVNTQQYLLKFRILFFSKTLI